jgi:hypothetical protein
MVKLCQFIVRLHASNCSTDSSYVVADFTLQALVIIVGCDTQSIGSIDVASGGSN